MEARIHLAEQTCGHKIYYTAKDYNFYIHFNNIKMSV